MFVKHNGVGGKQVRKVIFSIMVKVIDLDVIWKGFSMSMHEKIQVWGPLFRGSNLAYGEEKSWYLTDERTERHNMQYFASW